MVECGKSAGLFIYLSILEGIDTTCLGTTAESGIQHIGLSSSAMTALAFYGDLEAFWVELIGVPPKCEPKRGHGVMAIASLISAANWKSDMNVWVLVAFSPSRWESVLFCFLFFLHWRLKSKTQILPIIKIFIQPQQGWHSLQSRQGGRVCLNCMRLCERL